MDGLLYMDAVITPHRSLTQRGFVVLISVVTALNCISAAVFIAMGATLVPVFLGLDLFAIVIAFLVSFNAAKRVQRVRVTSAEVRVTSETAQGATLVWESPTAFTRVALETEDDRAVELKLALSGKEAPIAQALSPPERAEFARALQDAIRAARRG